MKTYTRFCESFGHISLSIPRVEKCAEKTNVAEEERDTQNMCCTSFVPALRLMKQRYVKFSEIETLLGNTTCRNVTFPLRREFVIRLCKASFIFIFIDILQYDFDKPVNPSMALGFKFQPFVTTDGFQFIEPCNTCLLVRCTEQVSIWITEGPYLAPSRTLNR
jgi:hypothetical protein